MMKFGNVQESEYMMDLGSQLGDEKVSGYPQPELYDQHYINRYAYPKGLKTCGRREENGK